ncbi:MAG: DUF4358 domain-containing protein [Erysipelotrichaceae bacterium]|nr:DUF4358 domain-containing protein [Erysipelotrichaceae bacterium]MDO5084989.1 DUF4358 domain-containing protein [Erysipelotrichaceae bacterium]
MRKVLAVVVVLILMVGCSRKEYKVHSLSDMMMFVQSIQNVGNLQLKETTVLDTDQLVSVFGLEEELIELASGLQGVMNRPIQDVLIIKSKDQKNNQTITKQLDAYYQQLFMDVDEVSIPAKKIVVEKQDLIFVIVAQEASAIKQYVEEALK